LHDNSGKTKGLHAETSLLRGAKMRNKLLRYSHLTVKCLLLFSGIFFLWICLFSFTTGPYSLYHFLGTGNSAWKFTPQEIIILGGSPMPGESALIRGYYARKLAEEYPDARIIISQLAEKNQKLSETGAWQLSQEIARGKNDSLRFGFLITARSTREEALLLKKAFPGIRGTNCLLITSPEHMYRAVATFKRAGYKSVGGEATFGWAGTADYRLDENKLGGRNIGIGAGNNLQLRYQFWNHLRYQLLCYREILALFWYRLRGWA
jgi:uncharacterized SAM-binding protein YcdF (DUF218 family)